VCVSVAMCVLHWGYVFLWSYERLMLTHTCTHMMSHHATSHHRVPTKKKAIIQGRVTKRDQIKNVGHTLTNVLKSEYVCVCVL
jgi:hypothetical protein